MRELLARPSLILTEISLLSRNQLAKGHGEWDDGCGGLTDVCGVCDVGLTCFEGVCCTPAACAGSGHECGTWDDGCGGSFECGGCTGPNKCVLGKCESSCAPVSVGVWNTPGQAEALHVVGNMAYVADGSEGLRIIDLSNPAAPEELGFLNTGGESYGVHVAGSHAYVADGSSGLRVFDVADPTTPLEVGTLDTPGVAYGIFIAGDYAFIADYNGGLRVLDVTNPASPEELGGVDTAGASMSVRVVGNLAYVADAGAGVVVVDVSKPSAPSIAATLDTPGTARDLQVVGNRLYVADGMAGLRILDISSPAVPVELGFLDTPGNAYAVEVFGRLAYIGDSGAGVEVVDVSDPTAPVLLAIYDTPGVAHGLRLMGSRLLVGDGAEGLRILDASTCIWGPDCGRPATVSCGQTLFGNTGWGTSAIATYSCAPGVEESGPEAVHIMYIPEGWRAEVSMTSPNSDLDLFLLKDGCDGLACSDVSASQEDERLSLTIGSDVAYRLAVDGRDGAVGAYELSMQCCRTCSSLAECGVWFDGCEMTDCGSCEGFETCLPSGACAGGCGIRQMGASLSPGSPVKVQVEGTRAYLAETGLSGLRIVDISDSTNPLPVFLSNISGGAQDLKIVGNLAYMREAGTCLRVIDISDLGNQIMVAMYCVGGGPGEMVGGIDVSGDWAYMTVGAAGLRIVDAHGQGVLATVGSLDTPGSALDVQVVGNLAYIADGDSGLQVVDVTTPASPVLIGTYNTPGTARSVSVVGDLAYVADGDKGLRVVNISVPTAPFSAGTYDTPGVACDVTVVGETAYVADDGEGVIVLDVSNPGSISFAGDFDTTAARGVAVVGTRAYVADGASGLRVLDVGHPGGPTKVGTAYAWTTAAAANVVGDRLYSVGASGVLDVFDVSDPKAPVYLGHDTGWWQTRGFEVIGNLVYLPDSYHGLVIIDVSNPTMPGQMAIHSLPGSVQAVRVSGGLAYVASQSGGLRIVDVSDPVNPRDVGSIKTWYAMGIDVAHNIAYVADYSAGLTIVDVSSPAAPVIIGTLGLPGISRSVQVIGDHAYVLTQDNGIRVVDVSNPEDPQELGSAAVSGASLEHQVVGGLAFTSNGYNGVQITDISNPAATAEVGTLDTDGYASGLSVDGSALYVADYYSVPIFELGDCNYGPDCTTPALLRCGQIYRGDTTYSPGQLGNYACTGRDQSGREAVHLLNVPEGWRVTATLKSEATDQDLHLLEGNCSAESCSASSAQAGDESLEFVADGQTAYRLVVDGGIGAMGPYELALECRRDCQPGECGQIWNGFDQWTDCGTCDNGAVCYDEHCCTPSCEGPDGSLMECGSDGCGGSCGECTQHANSFCDNGVCACAPFTCESAGWECGSTVDGCGKPLVCPQCPAGRICTAHASYPFGTCLICPPDCYGADADDDGFSPQFSDCNDSASSVHPGASEVCNGVDEDCDGTTDEDPQDPNQSMATAFDLGDYPAEDYWLFESWLVSQTDYDYFSIYAVEDSSYPTYIKCKATLTYVPEGTLLKVCACWGGGAACTAAAAQCVEVLGGQTGFVEVNLSDYPFTTDKGTCNIWVTSVQAIDCAKYKLSAFISE